MLSEQLRTLCPTPIENRMEQEGFEPSDGHKPSQPVAPDVSLASRPVKDSLLASSTGEQHPAPGS